MVNCSLLCAPVNFSYPNKLLNVLRAGTLPHISLMSLRLPWSQRIHETHDVLGESDNEMRLWVSTKVYREADLECFVKLSLPYLITLLIHCTRHLLYLT